MSRYEEELSEKAGGQTGPAQVPAQVPCIGAPGHGCYLARLAHACSPHHLSTHNISSRAARMAGQRASSRSRSSTAERRLPHNLTVAQLLNVKRRTRRDLALNGCGRHAAGHPGEVAEAADQAAHAGGGGRRELRPALSHAAAGACRGTCAAGCAVGLASGGTCRLVSRHSARRGCSEPCKL